jgi:thiol:disulfide interchange protein DsbD
MHRLREFVAVSLAAFLFLAMPVAGQPDAGKPKPKAAVTLVASVDAVVPGRPFDAGLQFQLESGWHIYWKNSGQSGLPPNVTWSLPDAVTAGDLQYPIPKRHVSPGDIITNVLGGEPVLLVRMTPAETLKTQHVTLAADVQYLVCKEKCLRESAKVAVELPLLPAGSETKPANAGLFRRARRALPKTSSKYLSITAATEPKALRSGGHFSLLVNVNIKRGYHIQSHEPLSPSFIKCDVFLERTNGVAYEEAAYPPPKFRKLKYVGKVSEYAGRIAVRIPARLDANAAPSPTQLGGIFKYQACNNKGTCFPPDAIAFAVPLKSERGAASGGSTGPAIGLDASASPRSQQAAGVDLKEAGPIATPEAFVAESGEKTLAAEGQLPGFLGRLGLAGLLVGCFIYGLFINATPCVLPLLSIKVLGFVQQAHESRRRTLALGLAFGAGVLIFFVVLGFLASSGKNVLQYPAAVIALGAVVMALALSMLGVYTLQVPAAAATLEASMQQEGLLASFGKGALAPVLGFACTAPMLAGVFGWATQQPPNIALVAFLAAGLGMASPYMLLGANPGWLGFLPKPGPWMITFERIMGFLLLGMVVWLLHPLVGRIGPEGLEWTLGFLVIVAMACWILGRVNISMPSAVRWQYRGGAAGMVLAGAVLVYGWVYPLADAVERQRATKLAGPSVTSGIAWHPWSAEAVQSAIRAGNTVFVDFTADYCTNCKVNKARAINQVQPLRASGRVGQRRPFPRRLSFPSRLLGSDDHDRSTPYQAGQQLVERNRREAR